MMKETTAPEETTAPFEVEAIAPAAVLKVRVSVQVAAKTDLGRVRENNEDKYEFFIPTKEETLATRGMAFVVCDGMGGAEAGQIASELACKTFLETYYHHPSPNIASGLEDGVRAASQYVIKVGLAIPQRKGMGTTLSALILHQDQAYVAHVGDSRIYRLQNDEIKQLTTDHTWVHEMVSLGQLTQEEADKHAYRHVITRAISTDGPAEADIICEPLQNGDVFMLCSDGLVNHVGDEEIREVLRTEGPSEAAWKLVGLALQGGGSDNTTVIVVKVLAMEPVEELELVEEGLELDPIP